MSDLLNDKLADEANDLVNSGELSSTPFEGLLTGDINNNDYESLYEHLGQARAFVEAQAPNDDNDREATDTH